MKTYYLANWPHRGWAPGDPIIYYGFGQLLGKDVTKLPIIYGDLPDDAEFVVRMATPAWLCADDRIVYKECLNRSIPLALLGIGTTICSFDAVFSHQEWIVDLVSSGLLRAVVARDKMVVWQFYQRGYSAQLLPCPGFYFFSAEGREPRRRKTRVALDLLDPRTTGYYGYCQRDYQDRIVAVWKGLQALGADVTVGVHRLHSPAMLSSSLTPDFSEWIEHNLGPYHIFYNKESFEEYYEQCDIYIGPRVHGCLPNAGRGALCYGYRIDQRALAWEQVPHIAWEDITYGIWNPRTVLDWYASLPDDITALSESMLHFRRRSEEHWRQVLVELGLEPG